MLERYTTGSKELPHQRVIFVGVHLTPEISVESNVSRRCVASYSSTKILKKSEKKNRSQKALPHALKIAEVPLKLCDFVPAIPPKKKQKQKASHSWNKQITWTRKTEGLILKTCTFPGKTWNSFTKNIILSVVSNRTGLGRQETASLKWCWHRWPRGSRNELASRETYVFYNTYPSTSTKVYGPKRWKSSSNPTIFLKGKLGNVSFSGQIMGMLV